jgi:hypothetical protein
MIRTEMTRRLVSSRLIRRAKRVLWSSDDLVPELQSTLRALADVEIRYEAARERIEREAIPGSSKHRHLAELEACHRLEVKPYARKLERLQHEIRSLMLP